VTTDAFVDVFRREYEATHSLDAAVAAVVTTVRARLDEARPASPPPTPLRVVPPPCRRPPGRAKVSSVQIVAVRAAVAALYPDEPIQRLFDRRWSTRRLAGARWVAAAVLRRLGMSMREIAQAVGLSDHTGVLYGLQQMDARPELACQADGIWERLSAPPWTAGQESAA
jgi:hypothetical protein